MEKAETYIHYNRENEDSCCNENWNGSHAGCDQPWAETQAHHLKNKQLHNSRSPNLTKETPSTHDPDAEDVTTRNELISELLRKCRSGVPQGRVFLTRMSLRKNI